MARPAAAADVPVSCGCNQEGSDLSVMACSLLYPDTTKMEAGTMPTEIGSPCSSSSLPLSLSGQKLSRRQSWRADEISASRELQVHCLQNCTHVSCMHADTGSSSLIFYRDSWPTCMPPGRNSSCLKANDNAHCCQAVWYTQRLALSMHRALFSKYTLIIESWPHLLDWPKVETVCRPPSQH